MEPSVSKTPSPCELSPHTPGDRSTQRKLSQFFGVESSDLTKPYHEASVTLSPGTRPKFGGLSPKISKKQNLADPFSLSSSTNNGHPCGSLGSQAMRQKNVGQDGAPGLLLKTQTPKFIRRFQNCEGPLKTFTKKDKSPNERTPLSKELSPVKRSRAKSLSIMFERNFPLHRKDDISLKPMVELSTEESSPGLLKIYGDKICPNAKYKTVLASGESSAVGLVKVALERFSLPVDTFGEYALCDVIGNYKTNPEKSSKILGISEDLEENREWIAECMRAMWDTERPLAVKSFWKPEEGFARRFEIRRRRDIETSDTDTVTAGLNINAKRLQQPRAYRAMTSASLLKPNNTDDDKKGRDLPLCEQDHAESGPQRQLSQAQMEKEETESTSGQPIPEIRESLITSFVPPPLDSPYLLILHGNNQDIDKVFYPLDDPVCLVGNSSGTVARADIELDASDINQEHCRIIKMHRSQSLGEEEGPNYWDIFLEPFGQSKVLLNGIVVYHREKLTSGDLISIGNKYLFFFKNPQVQSTSEPPLMRLLSGQSDLSNQSHEIKNQDAPLIARQSNPRIAAKAKEYMEDKQRLKLSYPMRNEDEVLNGIASLFQQSEESRSDSILSLAYLSCMCLEHSAYNFGEERTKTLMLKMATLMQTLAWDKTKDTTRNQQQKPIDVQPASFLPDLRAIICLLSNAMEVLNFLQTNMGDYIAMESRGDEGRPGIEDEALVEMDEVVMYLFQQMVYYLTKNLFIYIPNFLDTNPFSDNQDADISVHSRGMDSVLSLFQMTFDLLHDLNIHPDIASQLFAYLLFFANASLFNMLIERGMSGKFFKWAKAVQMRGNLDILEMWIQDHDLQDQTKFLKRVSTSVNLLATPKAQLMQADWGTLQRDYPELNTLQRHHLLSHYQLGSNQLHPTRWSPPTEQLKYAKETENLLESFENHPALVLPDQDFRLDLRHPVGREYLAEKLNQLKRRHSYITVSAVSVIDDGTANQNSTSSRQPAEAQIPRIVSASTNDTNKPVPPPRTKSYRYTASAEKDAGLTPIEMLEHSVEVPQATPELCS